MDGRALGGVLTGALPASTLWCTSRCMIRRTLLASLLASSLAACGGGGPTPISDAGTQQLGCTPDELDVHLGVLVVDAQGAPVRDVEVTAKNLGSGKTISATTDADGITAAIGTSMGSGSVHVTAKQGSRLSDTKQAEFQCGACTCTISPPTITLTIPN